MAEIGKDIQKATELLINGEVVGIPTETVYGLAANALDSEAVMKIFKAKKRPSFDPLIVHVASMTQLEQLVKEVPEPYALLMDAFWPGPLTLLFEKKNTVPDVVTSGLDTVAIRMPMHHITNELLKTTGFPLAAPSANPFGYISPTTANHVNDQLGDAVPYILDGGASSVGLESTIVGFQNNELTVFRFGGLSQAEIEEKVGKINYLAHSTSNPKAPGMLKSHYAPKIKLVIGHVPTLIEANEGKKIGTLSFNTNYEGPLVSTSIVLSEGKKMEEAAQKLFAALRQLDAEPLDVILCEAFPNEGLGMAINDRLRRASVN